MATTCQGFYKNGNACRYRAKYNGFCGLHVSHEAPGPNAECPICQDALSGVTKAMTLPCKHKFCKECVVEWLGRKNTCPLCRAVVPKGVYSLHKLRTPAPEPLDFFGGDLQGWVLFQDDLVGLATAANAHHELGDLADELQNILRTLGTIRI